MRIPQLCLAAMGFAALLVTVPAQAELLITVDKSAQRMTVAQDGEQLYVWPVSTGASGYDTPNGDWKPFRMEKDHFSKEWDDAPMPNSIFFTMEGHAIHGTFETKNLGKPVSHGCVRLSRANSEILWGLVKKNKMANTKVVLKGEIPGGAGVPVARKPSSRPQQAQEYERYYSTDDEYSDYAAQQRQRAAGTRGYDNSGHYYYYYRDQPAPAPVERRYYRAGSNNPPPSFFPFGW